MHAMHVMHAVHVEATIAAIAARQHGLVKRRQLLDAGMSSRQVQLRVETGRFHVVRPGIYRTGAIAAPFEREAAALLSATGPAVLSHVTAAGIWTLRPSPGATQPIEMLIVRGYRPPDSGLIAHRTRELHPDEVASRHGLAITTPERTLYDMATRLDDSALERMVARAERERLLTPGALDALLDRHRGRPAAARLRDVTGAGAQLTRSEFEAEFLAATRAARLPAPRTNFVLAGVEVDFYWEKARLVVELDGFAFHSTPAAIETDHRRDIMLTGAGIRVMRFTWRQFKRERDFVISRLGAALASALTIP